MASNKRAKAMCDISGFVYPMRVMRLNSYGLLVGPPDYDGQYDLKNHPQNQAPSLREDPTIKNARVDDLGRNQTWEQLGLTWDDTTKDRWWQMV